MKKTVTFTENNAIANEEKLVTMKKAIGYLLKLGVPSKIAADSKSCEMIFFLKVLFNDDPSFTEENTKWRFFSRTKFDLLLVRLFAHFSDICNQFEINDKFRLSRTHLSHDLDENGRKICMLDCLIFIINKLTDLQFHNEIMLSFNKKLLDHKLLEVLLSFFKRDKYLNKNTKWYDSHDSLIGIMAAIRNLTECPYYDKKIWRRVDVEGTLTRFATMSRFPEFHSKLTLEIMSNMHQKSLVECLEELNLLEPSIILDSEMCYHDVSLVKFLVMKPIFSEYVHFIKHEWVKIAPKVLDCFLKLSIDIQQAEILIDGRRSLETPPLTERRLTTCYNILYITNELAFKSIELCLCLCDPAFFEILAKFISAESMCLNKKRLVTLALNNLYLLSRYSDELHLDLGGQGLVDKLLELVRSLREDQMAEEPVSREIILNSLYCVGNLADDGHIEKMPSNELEFLLSRLLLELESIVDQIEWSDLRKSSMKASQALTGNMMVLTRLAVNSRAKKLLFSKRILYRRIILSGNRLEKVCALKLLTQLCFDDEIADELGKDVDLLNYTRQLSLNAKHHRLRKSAQTILWWLENRTTSSTRKEFAFISHHNNKSVRRICSRVVLKLAKNGIRTIVAEQLNENSMEAIGKVIRESEWVVICVCRKYRLDERCQAEAKFASRLNKPIVLLDIEEITREIRIDSWLGEVSRGRPRINFVGRDFNECVKELATTLIQLKNIEYWTPEDVSEWLDSNNIHPSITKLYAVFDGFTLKQIYNLKKLTPEFYFQTLANETNHQISTSEIAFFAQKLESLFNNYQPPK